MKTSLSQNPLNFTTPKPTSHIIYSAYERPKHKVSTSFAPGSGRTKQSFKDETNINNIMAKFQRTGVLDFASKHEARYGDVIGADYQRAMFIVAQGNTMFHDLPSSLRSRFENDPGKFLAFMEDPDTIEEQRELGLRLPKADEGTPVSTPPAPKAPAAPKEPKRGSSDDLEEGNSTSRRNANM